jgi:hypothetical protein
MLLMPPSALAAAVSTCTATSSQWGPPLALAVPPFESSPSFPSWHTLNATVVLGVTAYLVVLGRRHLRSRLLVGSLVGVRAGHGPVPGLARRPLAHRRHCRGLVGLARLGTVVTAHRVKVTLGRAEGRGQLTPDRATTARPASSRATGTRNGEHDT